MAMFAAMNALAFVVSHRMPDWFQWRSSPFIDTTSWLPGRACTSSFIARQPTTEKLYCFDSFGDTPGLGPGIEVISVKVPPTRNVSGARPASIVRSFLERRAVHRSDRVVEGSTRKEDESAVSPNSDPTVPVELPTTTSTSSVLIGNCRVFRPVELGRMQAVCPVLFCSGCDVSRNKKHTGLEKTEATQPSVAWQAPQHTNTSGTGLNTFHSSWNPRFSSNAHLCDGGANGGDGGDGGDGGGCGGDG